jgi:hypothetical protein
MVPDLLIGGFISWPIFFLWHFIGGIIFEERVLATLIGGIVFTALIGAMGGPLISKHFSKSAPGEDRTITVSDRIGGAIGGAIIGVGIGYIGAVMIVIALD